MKVTSTSLVLVTVLVSGAASAQLKKETATRKVDLLRLKLRPEERVKHELDSWAGRYRYQIACHRRLLRLERQLRQCIETQRMVGGEFHTRLDFVVLPSGKVQSFTTRHGQLQVCLLPRVQGVRFPAFGSAKHKTYRLIVLAASPGVRLGRRVKAVPVEVYPAGTPDEQRAYKRAAGWVASPWTRAIGFCVELVDRTMGYGYRARFGTELSPAGRAVRSTLLLKGELASAAADQLMACSAPFLRGMRVPRHAGPGPVLFIHGSSSARWQPD